MVKLCGVKVLPFLVLVLMLTVLAEQGQAHPCGSTFFSALIQMIPCRAAVAPFSPIQPSELCCSAVKALGQPCLCTLVNGPPISGVDRNMALQLPDKCSANFEPCNSLSQKTRARAHTPSLRFFFFFFVTLGHPEGSLFSTLPIQGHKIISKLGIKMVSDIFFLMINFIF
jgi:hypothetical protein